MKIALIFPEFTMQYSTERFEIPLGLSYIAAVLEEENFQVDGFNLNVDRINEINPEKYDLIGIYASTPMFQAARKLARIFKQGNPEVFIVIGGPHPTVCPEQVSNSQYIDAVVIGEGEYTMRELAMAIKSRVELSSVNGIMYKTRNAIKKTPPRPILHRLDDLPLPAKHIFYNEKYPSRSFALGAIAASRGCPYKCSNCKPALDYVSSYRIRSVGNVVDEIEYLIKNQNVSNFHFVDSEFIGPKRWILDFCSEVKRRKLTFGFVCAARADQVDQAVLKKVKGIGCEVIGYGIESGSQRVIDDILHKGISLKKAREIINQTTKYGIKSLAWFMVGIPGETYSEIMETIEFAKSIRVNSIVICYATPWPGTGFYQIAKSNGWLVIENFDEYDERQLSVINTPYLSPDDVKRVYKIFVRTFIKIGWRWNESQVELRHPSFPKLFHIVAKKLIRGNIRLKDIAFIFYYLRGLLLRVINKR